MELPEDIRQITRFNGVRWVHDYQEACIDKVERFIKGELNRMPSLGSTASIRNPSINPTQPVSTTSTTIIRKNNYNLSRTKPAGTTTTSSPAPSSRAKTSTTHLDAHPPISQQNSANNSSAANTLANRSASMEKQRRKLISSSVSTVCSANSER